MGNQELRLRRALLVPTFDATNVPLDGNIRRVCRAAGLKKMKCGELPFPFILTRRRSITYMELTPVDPAGGHRYRSSIKTCESSAFSCTADCSVTRGQRALKWGITSGN